MHTKVCIKWSKMQSCDRFWGVWFVEGHVSSINHKVSNFQPCCRKAAWYWPLVHVQPLPEKLENPRTLVKSVRICPIHFCIVERQQVRKHFPMHVGYLETCQCCASLLLRSLDFRSNLPTLPTQERQLCVDRTVAIFNKHQKYAHRWEGQSSCNPTSPKRAVEY